MMKFAVIDPFPLMLNGLENLLADYFSPATIIKWNRTEDLLASTDFPEVGMIIIGMTHFNIGNLIEKIKEVRNSHPDTPVVIYDDMPDPAFVIECLRLGVKGYLSKTTSPADLIDSFKDVLQGKQRIGMDIIETILLNRNFSPYKAASVGNPNLTAHEFLIARYLSEGMKPKQIAAMLNRKPSTISTIKSIIFRKLKISSVFELREFVTDAPGRQPRLN